jgi:hypothetical protein
MPDFFRKPRELQMLLDSVPGYNTRACKTKGGEVCWACYAPGDHMMADSDLGVHRAAIAQ